MAPNDDARAWLRANGYQKIADDIDSIIGSWRAHGIGTRRNWWDVLAGTLGGRTRTVEGIVFPILSAARLRKNWPAVDDEIELEHGEVVPVPVSQTRWMGTHRRQTGRKPVKARSRSSSKEKAGTTGRPRRNGSRPGGEKGDTREPQGPASELSLRNFAHLENVVVPLRDLVVLVGPQATGKSLVLEVLKLAIDRNRIVRSLKEHGFAWDKGEEFSALYFGGGFEKSWSSKTEIQYGKESISLDDVAKARAYRGEDAVFYIPAHRTLAIAEGWPRSFSGYQVETPFVARRFSEELLTSLNQGLVGKGKIFPHDRRLKEAFRRLIDEAVFHGATLKLDTLGMRKQFVLEYGENDARLPFMAWTAGQREFTPLLLGLYHLLPAGGGPKKREIQWAIIEEPEMGLHPKAIVAIMAVVLDLLARGYKVALSTHSPTVLEVVWGMSRLKGLSDGASRLCRMMGLPDRDRNVLKTAVEALGKSYAVIHVQHGESGGVVSKDISSLDPGSAEPREWGWGGLTGFSARVAEVVATSRAGK